MTKGFETGESDSIELAPVESPGKGSKGAGKAAKKGSDPSATSLPIKTGKEKDIFEDTDFEVDALDSGGEDRTMQLEASSDFEVEESDSASEVFALDEEDVDVNAATAMRPSAIDDADMGTGSSDEESAWSELASVESTTASGSMAASPALAARDTGAEWPGWLIGALGVSAFLVLLSSMVAMDLVRNLYEFKSDGPASGLVRMLAGLFGS
jgi:hypothetical protein